MVLNAFRYSVNAGVNAALNGVPILPGETPTSAQCKTAISVFAIDYDAPTAVAEPVQLRLLPIIGSTKLA